MVEVKDKTFPHLFNDMKQWNVFLSPPFTLYATHICEGWMQDVQFQLINPQGITHHTQILTALKKEQQIMEFFLRIRNIYIKPADAGILN